MAEVEQLDRHYRALSPEPIEVVEQAARYLPTALVVMRAGDPELVVALGGALVHLVKIAGRRWGHAQGVEGYMGRGGEEDEVKWAWWSARLLSYVGVAQWRAILEEIGRIPWGLREPVAGR